VIEQGSVAWLQARCGKITGSRADDLLSEGKTKGTESAGWRNYRAQLVVERLTGEPAEEGFVSDAMKRGTEKEPAARSWYGDKVDTIVTQLGFTLHHELPFVGASVDGEVEHGVGGLEIKCPNTANHIDTLLYGGTKYKPQIQFVIWVMGWQWCDFVTFDDRLPQKLWGSLQRFERDDPYIATIKTKAILLDSQVNELVAKLRAL
jgi:hypothetical protein